MSEFGEVGAPGMPAHVYFHVPFCSSKCSYCDFDSIADADPREVHAVFSGMEAEVFRWANSALPGVVETVYVGGGTPSLHPAPVAQLVSRVCHELVVRTDAEITVEANPESITVAGLEALVDVGVNRVSLGVQAFDDRVLELLGRRHDASRARETAALVGESDVDLAVDLICGVPGQTLASWAESIEEALDAGACHVSVYPLALEEGTPLAAAVSGGLVTGLDADEAAEMMLHADARLADAGLARYEVANWARPGHEARHNVAYWKGSSYAGIGPAAHGMLEPSVARVAGLHMPVGCGDSVARVRYANEPSPERWLVGGPSHVELLAEEDAEREDVMLGMRLSEGVSAIHIERVGLSSVLEGLAAQGLTELADGRWRMTTRGWLLGNEVFGRIWNREN
jgi:oxygen-independent coproporphyrinogen-3 oxidase